MKIKEKRVVYEVTGFICDVCMTSVCFEDNDMEASLSAKFGYGSDEDGNEYHLDLCPNCFKKALAELKRIRRDEFMFDEKVDEGIRSPEDFGLVKEVGSYLSQDDG